MSNELVRLGQKSLATKSGQQTAGKSLAVAGGGGLALWAVAGMVPFINGPFLMLVALAFGIYFLTKGK